MFSRFWLVLLCLLVFVAGRVACADVVINELMYHPASENPAEEYIELYNSGAVAVSVSGWQFTSGVAFMIPAGTSIAPGGYLVVAANAAAFQAKHPGVTNFVAGWTGQLSNSSNNVVLVDALGVLVDSVDYADDGDWAERRRDDPPDFGHRGWGWHSDADGFGKSLELINPAFDNSEGQNWASSTPPQGTPGGANSVAAADIAPVIAKADHFPLVPKSADAVTISCRVRDDHAAALTVQLHYRIDGVPSFTTATMFDDGAHGDAAAGDGFFGATILPKANGTIVEFYFTASDGALTRTWPAPARDFTGALVQTQNCLYQVDDTTYAGAEPIYRMILRAVDRTELSNINSDSGTPPFPYNAGEVSDQTYSHAKFNATWVTHDGTGDSIVYLAGVRNRGNGSRSALPQNYNVTFRNSDAWKGVTSLNLNTQNTPYQLLGSAIFRKAGLTTAESRAVQVRVNGANLAGSGAPSHGFYVANEMVNSDFAAHHFPLDSSGNIYRAFRQDPVGGANLRDQSAGQPAATADPTPYRVSYFKQTNQSEDDWSDLIGLTKTLAKGTSAPATYTATYTGDYVSAVQAAADTAQWLRFIAVNTIADNTETNITNGDGDDYNLYFGVADPRAVFIPYDLDSIFGRSAASSDATHNLFRAARGDTAGNPPTPLHPFLIHPQFAREYLAEVKRQIDGPFNTAQFAVLADETLGGVVSAPVINAMKAFHNARLAYIASVMPLSLSSISATTTGGTALTITSGYPRSTAATVNLRGKADCTRTASVKVNGVTTIYTPWKVTTVSSFATSIGDWQAGSVVLTPGLNRVLVQAFDAAGTEFERTFFDVWYDDASVASVSGAIAANTSWTAAGGPYQVTAALTVNSGATLTIQPGTTVYLASGTGITVAGGGRILAEGTEALPIRFSRAPGGTGNGGTITINGQAGVAETHFYHTYFEFGGDPAVTCEANSNVIFEHCEWLRNTAAYLHLDGASFLVSNCIFPSSAAGAYFEGVHGNGAPPVGGRAIIRDSFFGKISSISSDYNDVVDFTGGNRPGTILQFYNNVMVGSDDDLLDIDGTDLWAEGNIFMHVHRSGSPDSASAISGGNDGGGGTGSRKAATAIDTATDQVTCGTHGFSTGQEVVATALLGNTFPTATPALHDGGPYFVRAVSSTAVKLYLTVADANADTNALNFTGTIGTNVSLSLTALSAISHITIVGNLFYDLDQAATAKEGNFYTFLNNTVVSQNNTGSQDAITGVLNFGDDDYHESAGMYAEGNIIHSAAALVRNYPGAGLVQTVTWNNNLFPVGVTWSGAGSGNQSADARLNDPANIPTPGPYDYQRVGAEIRQKFGLQAGSPARGTGPNGSDKGGVRALGVTLGGAPVGTTNATTTSIAVGTRMTGSGIPSGAGAWQNGSGWTHYKWRLNGGAWSAETANTAPISLSGLSNGVQTLEVVGKNDAGLYQDDATLGADARISSVSWTVDTNYVPPAAAPLVQISEVLAKNSDTLGFGGNFPDIIELRNAGTASADLSGWGLTDNAALPFKYTIASGTTLAAGARLVIYASSSGSVPTPKTGFGLKDTGDTLTLSKSAAAGGGIADSVAFGAQLADVSAGRRESDGAWDMCRPTFGAANIVAAQATPAVVRINEWLANAVALFPNDFIELMNTGGLPVNVGKCFVSDNPVEWPQHVQLRQLTFIAPGGFLYLKADNDAAQGPDHLNFKLASEQGEIGFLDSALKLVDSIVYGPQTSDISQGRTPNGASTVAFFNQPTPGGPNPGVSGVTVSTTNLIPATQTWRYRSNGTNHSADFFTPAFNDSTWTNAPQLLYIETAALTNSEGFTKATQLPGDTANSNLPFNATYYRTHFNYSGPLSGVTLRAKAMVDDGAIFYLNGQEIIPTNLGARLRMPAGAVTFSTIATGNVGDAGVETLTFDSATLVSGDNVFAVAVHQEHGAGTQTSSDVTFGLKLDAETTSSAGAGALVINEVLPINVSFQNPDGSYGGWVELFNPTGAAINVSDMSFSDDTSVPRKFVFGAGANVPAGGYLVTFFNPLAPASATNTGFALPTLGGGAYLFEKTAAGGGLHDGVSYGLQVADFALGRTPNGTGAFALTVPTRAALNTAAGLGSVSGVKLNEWLANPASGAGFFEVFNTGAQPVALGGNYLTDLLTNKTKHLVPPLSFIGGSGSTRWRHFVADNDASATPGHVNFSLNPFGESLGIFSGAGVQLDAISFGSQTSGVAQGRLPDGTSAIVSLTPTPGSANVPAPADTDGDGIPDAWEAANGLNPNDPGDAGLDADGDGQSNRAEYLAGTNPQSGASRLAAALVTTATPGQFAVRFTAIAGKTYTVRYKNDLAAATWTKLLDVPAQAADTLLDATDPNGVGQPRRFYQVITPAQP
jgi:hypothetical protein